MAKKFIAEFIGTFFLVLAIGLCTLNVPLEMRLWAPIGIGGTLLAMIFSMGHISKAHYNPAVTVAFWLRGYLPHREVPLYFLAEFGGGLLAAFTCILLKGANQVFMIDLPPSNLWTMRVLLAEFLFTFALAWVIMNVATAKTLVGNQHYGLAIVGIVVGGAYSVGSISGAIFNPAVAVSMCLMHLGSWQYLWVYLFANFAGGAAAGLSYKVIYPHD